MSRPAHAQTKATWQRAIFEVSRRQTVALLSRVQIRAAEWSRFRLSEPAPRVAAILHPPSPILSLVPGPRPPAFSFTPKLPSLNPMSSPDPTPADQFTPAQLAIIREMILDAGSRADRDSTDHPSDAPRGPPDPPQPQPGPSTSTGRHAAGSEDVSDSHRLSAVPKFVPSGSPASGLDVLAAAALADPSTHTTPGFGAADIQALHKVQPRSHVTAKGGEEAPGAGVCGNGQTPGGYLARGASRT